MRKIIIYSSGYFWLIHRIYMNMINSISYKINNLVSCI